MVSTDNVSNAVEFYFVKPNVPDVSPYNHTVNHLDISIEGGADVQIPLAYGKYYEKIGEQYVEVLKIEDGKYYEKTADGYRLIPGLDDEHPITVHKDINIYSDDIKSATLVAKDKNGNEVSNAFYITGYSANERTADDPVQVRIEGSFKVATIDPINTTQWGDYTDPNQGNTKTQRVQNRVYYTVTTIKRNENIEEVKWTDSQGVTHILYSEQYEKLSFKADITVSATFDYWDLGNTCPPVNGKDYGRCPYWQGGGIFVGYPENFYNPQFYVSGIDYRLSGDNSVSKAQVLGMEVTKYIMDSDGNQIAIDASYHNDTQHSERALTNRFVVYEKKADVQGYDPDDVKDINVNDSIRKSEGLPTEEEDAFTKYTGYTEHVSYDLTTTVDETGKGMAHNYNVEEGMYYIKEDPTSIAKTIKGSNGVTFKYVKTFMESEYAWRGNPDYDGYEEPVHLSPVYSKLEGENVDSFCSIPEVIGNYKDDSGAWIQADGTALRNTFLPFYVYNIYEPSVDIHIEKIDEETRERNPISYLENAKFKLFKQITVSGNTSYQVYPDEDSCIQTSGEDGLLTFADLNAGKYKIKELAAPDGYTLEADMEIFFQIDAHGNIKWTNESGTVITSQNMVTYDGDTVKFTVGNTPGAELPSTGGSGTVLYTIMGTILLLISSLLLVQRRAC